METYNNDTVLNGQCEAAQWGRSDFKNSTFSEMPYSCLLLMTVVRVWHLHHMRTSSANISLTRSEYKLSLINGTLIITHCVNTSWETLHIALMYTKILYMCIHWLLWYCIILFICILSFVHLLYICLPYYFLLFLSYIVALLYFSGQATLHMTINTLT